jgi:hypothetical protein
MTDIEIETSSSPHCPLCAQPALLVVRVPHAITRADGTTITGTRGVALCETCDRDDPAAQGLLAYFALYETVGEESVATAGALIREWVNRVIERGVPATHGSAEAADLDARDAEMLADLLEEERERPINGQ